METLLFPVVFPTVYNLHPIALTGERQIPCISSCKELRGGPTRGAFKLGSVDITSKQCSVPSSRVCKAGGWGRGLGLLIKELVKIAVFEVRH